MTKDQQRQQRHALIAALRTHLPWARVAGLSGWRGLPGFSLAVGWMLLRRPGMLRGGTLRQAATDLTVAALAPVTLVAVALALVLGGWPLNLLVSVGLPVVDAMVFTVSAAARGGVWVFDGWHAGVMLTRKDPWEGWVRFEVAQYWALPPGRGHGRRLREEGMRLADRLGVVLELEAMNPGLARGIYHRAGFEIAPGQQEHRRPRMRRVPHAHGGPSGPLAATDDVAHVDTP
ncbi:MAG TPA: hypothetical protein VL551_11675 [Actinospica sp.]|jgi:hypothetical protein|nr:hypothetical protein [Actinospica sp.]